VNPLAQKTSKEIDSQEGSGSVSDFLQILGWLFVFVFAQTQVKLRKATAQDSHSHVADTSTFLRSDGRFWQATSRALGRFLSTDGHSIDIPKP